MPPSLKTGNSIFFLISTASPVVKFVLLLLLLFSVISWAIIVFKLFEYAKNRKDLKKFIDYFRKSKNFLEINKFAHLAKNNPLARIFMRGYKELSIQMGPQVSSEVIDSESIERSMVMASSSEITRLERLNGFLATTATVTPFIGLFGTVWGIMDSFMEIGRTGNANLATVAPGIAEALIATALGLFAAIPAVIFYNLLLNKLKVLISTMEDFILEFLNVSKKLQ
ncbi:MAG: MotA/TolQ/ExbB proton channel family protein [Candidatus Aminicenantes bacterium]|nr:MotA/TolQ/ExbB proton channel family protein [Candidatus Aminicenantes bacterium]